MEHNECQKTKPSQGGSVYPSVGALAEELNISRQSAYDALQRGEIPAIRIGKRWSENRMKPAPAARPNQTSAERPAPNKKPEVFLRDFDGNGARRIPGELAARMVSAGIADQVSAAGHVRLKSGVRFLPNGDTLQGISAIELSRFYRGDAVTARDARHKDYEIGR